ncbi:hypothetical protein TNCV_2223981 [Trichonephila clavipes]|nr:hypothetical protein TNCV_2223981 [Trichonephila clavipes]
MQRPLVPTGDIIVSRLFIEYGTLCGIGGRHLFWHGHTDDRPCQQLDQARRGILLKTHVRLGKSREQPPGASGLTNKVDRVSHGFPNFLVFWIMVVQCFSNFHYWRPNFQS